MSEIGGKMSQLGLAFLQFKWNIFQFCGMSEAIDLDETVQDDVMYQPKYLKTKMLTRNFINGKN